MAFPIRASVVAGVPPSPTSALDRAPAAQPAPAGARRATAPFRAPLRPADVLHLQRTIGNRATLAVLHGGGRAAPLVTRAPSGAVQRLISGAVSAAIETVDPGAHGYDRLLLKGQVRDYEALPMVKELVAHAGHGALSLCVGDPADERLLRVAAEHLDTAVSGAEQLLLTLKVIISGLNAELRAASPAFAKLVDKLPTGVEIDLRILEDVKRLLSVYRALAPADQDFLIPWMAVRAGANTLKAAMSLVDGMRSDEVQAAVTEWRAHTAAAAAHREGSEREVEELVTKGLGASKVLAKVAAGLDLRKLSGTVVALDDTAFAEAHFASFCALNAGMVSTEHAKAAAARREAQRVDRVEGFRSEVDGRIYVRKGAISRHLVVHESLHRLGGNKLEELLGHGLMEGATETIARLISTELDIPLEQSGYAIERQALGLLLKAADIDSQELVAAYFTENVAAFTRKLVAAAGLEGLKELRSSPNPMVAVNAWTAVYGRRLTAQAEADKKKAAAIKADADSCIVS